MPFQRPPTPQKGIKLMLQLSAMLIKAFVISREQSPAFARSTSGVRIVRKNELLVVTSVLLQEYMRDERIDFILFGNSFSCGIYPV